MLLKAIKKRGIVDVLLRCLGLLSLFLAASVPYKEYQDQHYYDDDDHYEQVNRTQKRVRNG